MKNIMVIVIFALIFTALIWLALYGFGLTQLFSLKFIIGVFSTSMLLSLSVSPWGNSND